MLNRILFDNTVFNYFGAIRSIDFYGLVTANLSTPFYVSEVVFKEANTPRLLTKYPILVPQLLDKIQPEGDVFRLCTTFDEVLKHELHQELDEGEAESIAQAQAIHSAIFVSDDLKAKQRLDKLRKGKKNFPVSDQFRMVSSFFLLALLEAQSLLPSQDFEDAKNEFYAIRKLGEQNERNKQVLIDSCCGEMMLAYELLGISTSYVNIKEKCAQNIQY